MAIEDGRCGECGSANLAIQSIRDVHKPVRKGDPQGAPRQVVARSIHGKCRRCGNKDGILRQVDQTAAKPNQGTSGP